MEKRKRNMFKKDHTGQSIRTDVGGRHRPYESRAQIHYKEEMGTYMENTQPPCLANGTHYYQGTIKPLSNNLITLTGYNKDCNMAVTSVLLVHYQGYPDCSGQQAYDRHLFSFSALCVLLPQYRLHQRKSGFFGEDHAGNALVALIAALLGNVPCAVLCKIRFSFSIKIDQND